MNRIRGFTLVELIIFIMIMGVLANTVLMVFNTVLRHTSTSHKQVVAAQSATRCIEWFVGQRSFHGYNTIGCPSTAVPNFCTVPSGYSIAVNVSCTTLYGDANYKTITVAVGGVGRSVLSALIADY